MALSVPDTGNPFVLLYVVGGVEIGCVTSRWLKLATAVKENFSLASQYTCYYHPSVLETLSTYKRFL